MAHEQSETYQDDNGQYYLGYGRGTAVPGQRLPNTPSFPSPEAAEPYAVARSRQTSSAQEQPLAIQRAWERAAAGGTSPMAQTGGMNVAPMLPTFGGQTSNVPAITSGRTSRNMGNALQAGYQELSKLDQTRRTPGGFTFNGVTMRPEDQIQQAVVVNPEDRVFQGLSRVDPRFAGSLQKMKPITEYLGEKVPTDFKKGVYGVTTGIPPQRLEDVAQGVASGYVHRGPVAITNPEMQRLVDYTRQAPGSTLQAIRPGPSEIPSAFHEGYHALYAAKNPMRQVPQLDLQRAQELMTRVLQRTEGMTVPEKIKVIERYYQDPAHGLIEALGRYRMGKARVGGMNVGGK